MTSFAAQLAASVTSFLVFALAGRSLTLKDFGIMALVWLVFAVLLSFTRLAIGEQALGAPDRAGASAVFSRTKRMHWAVMGTAVTVAASAILLGGADSSASYCLVIVVALQMMLDRERFKAFADGRPTTVLVSDTVGLISAGTVLAFVLATGVREANLFFGAWLTWNALQWTLLAVTNRRRIIVTDLPPDESHSTFVRWLAVQSLLGSGAVQLTPVIVLAFVGLDDFAGLRASQQLTLPVLVLVSGANVLIIPRLRALPRPIEAVHACQRMSALLLVPGFIVVGLAIAVGAPVMRGVYGPTLGAYSQLLAPMAAVACIGAVVAPAGVAMRMQRLGREILLGQACGIAIGLPAVAVAAWLSGVELAAWCMVAQTLITSIVSYRLLIRRARQNASPE